MESILAQTYSNIELIFVNDGSRDRTEEIVLSYSCALKKKGVKFIYLYQENAGQAAALNKGLAIFTGEYLTWPDSDDILHPESLEKKVGFLKSHSQYEMVRTNGNFFSLDLKSRLRRISSNEKVSNENIFIDLVLGNTYCCCGCYMITRKIFFQIYPQKEILVSRVGQNWQMLIPVASVSLCGYIDESLYFVYERECSHSREGKSFEDRLKRLEDLEFLLLKCLDFSHCNIFVCKEMVLKNYTHKRLMLACVSWNKDLLSCEYKRMKEKRYLSFTDVVCYIMGKCGIIHFLWLCLNEFSLFSFVKRLLKR